MFSNDNLSIFDSSFVEFSNVTWSIKDCSLEIMKSKCLMTLTSALWNPNLSRDLYNINGQFKKEKKKRIETWFCSISK